MRPLCPLPLAASLLVMLLVAGCASAQPQARPPATTGPPAPAPVVPAMVGMTLMEAQDALSESGYEWYDRERDLSWRHREINSPHGWTVALTVPAAGAHADTDEAVYLFVLRDREYAWFENHPTMPRVQARRAWDLTAEGGALADVEDLVEFRYARNQAPRYARKTSFRSRPETPSVTPNPSAEPDASYERRTRLREAPDWEKFARTLQPPGEVLRPGQILTVLVRREPRSGPVRTGGGTPREEPLHLHPDDDDDDFNVPGWLCPTRFC